MKFSCFFENKLLQRLDARETIPLKLFIVKTWQVKDIYWGGKI